MLLDGSSCILGTASVPASFPCTPPPTPSLPPQNLFQFPIAGAEENMHFQFPSSTEALFLKSFGEASSSFPGIADSEPSTLDGIDFPLDFVESPELDSRSDNSLFADAFSGFRTWRQDGDDGSSLMSSAFASSSSSGRTHSCDDHSLYSLSPADESRHMAVLAFVKTERCATPEDEGPSSPEGSPTAPLPSMIPGSRCFAEPLPRLLLPTGSNVVDLVSGVTCSEAGMAGRLVGRRGACRGARKRRDVIGGLARASHTSLAVNKHPAGEPQGCFGHLVRPRPSSLNSDLDVGQEVRALELSLGGPCPKDLSDNQVLLQQGEPEPAYGLAFAGGRRTRMYTHPPAAAASVKEFVKLERLHTSMHDDDHVTHPDDAEDNDDDDDDVFLPEDVASQDHQQQEQMTREAQAGTRGVDDGSDDEDDVGGAECRWAECGLQFAGRASLVRHIEKVHVEPRRGEDFACLWHLCPRGARPFNARYKLLIHMRVHSGEKPNKCPFSGCPKAFSRLENLKIHQRSHTGERPYCCQFPGCCKAFSNSSDRAKHQRTHFDTKPYACQVAGCSKRYTDPSSLRKHVKNHGNRDHAHASAKRTSSESSLSTVSTGSDWSVEAPAPPPPAALDSQCEIRLQETSSEPQPVQYERPTENCTHDELKSIADDCYADVSLDDANFPSPDDIDQAIREFIPFEAVGKLLLEHNGNSNIGLNESLDLDFDIEQQFLELTSLDACGQVAV